VENVLRVDLEVDRPIDGQDELVRLHLLVGIVERPRELLTRDVHDQLLLLLGLDVVEHDPAVDRERGDDDERDRHPHDLELGVAVDVRAVAALTGLGAERDHAVDRHRHDQHEDRHGDDHQDVVERVDLIRLRRALAGEPVDLEADQHPDGGRDDAYRDHPRERMLLVRWALFLGRALGRAQSARESI
jgi:hypothetical protein